MVNRVVVRWNFREDRYVVVAAETPYLLTSRCRLSVELVKALTERGWTIVVEA